jgi:hypothetical protein
VIERQLTAPALGQNIKFGEFVSGTFFFEKKVDAHGVAPPGY